MFEIIIAGVLGTFLGLNWGTIGAVATIDKAEEAAYAHATHVVEIQQKAKLTQTSPVEIDFKESVATIVASK